MKHSNQRNSLKRRALDVFALYGNLNPAAWAVLAKMQPVRAAYTYLLRLHHFGLLDRSRDPRGLLIYSISQRGRDRLQWLSSQQKPNDPKTILNHPNGDHTW
jgi:hypothetical protein